MNIKRLLRKLKMRLLLKSIDIQKSLEFWLFSTMSDDDRNIKHLQECNKHLLNMHAECRLELLSWKQKKIGYLVAELTKDKTSEKQNRLFQSLLEHNQIQALHEADRIQRALAKQKDGLA